MNSASICQLASKASYIEGTFLTALKMLKSLLNMRREIESEDRFTMEGGADLSITRQFLPGGGQEFSGGREIDIGVKY